MIVLPIHILANPLALLLTALDAYVLTAAVYLIVNRLVHEPSVCWHPLLDRIITAPAQFIEKRLALWRSRAIPAWQPWTVVFAGALILRQLLAALIMFTL